ncbi:cytochrome P450 [Mycolicibacterium komossense]|uniref:Cytochrome P450 n=1 Tax=Mycolicibacterium komossense TaxID=1779 RepID=A0ABT3C948_9MYCO|nr:cytochrome P450 [Mycolicibacterium komossense]MCV7225977.1 cytochrome P450 [Mycolicibacterium komossense]
MTQATEVPLYMRRDVLDPSPALGEIRDSTPVRKLRTAMGMPAYLVTRHEDVRAALADPQRFSNHKPPGWAGGPHFDADEHAKLTAGNLLALDPPEHQRIRRMLTPEFTVRRMQRLEPRIVEIVDQHLDAMEQAGAPADLIARFALPIPSLVICELLGVPYEDREEFQHRATRQLNFSIPVKERMALGDAAREHMMSLVQRARRDPGDDMLGMLVRERGTEVTDDELVGIGGLLLLAGHETTSNMLGLGTIALLQRPEQLAVVRDDPDAVGPAVEELMRYLSVVQNAIARVTTTDVEIDGVVIPEGQIVILSLPAANRDPRFIDHPDALDIGRGAPGHLGFGHGVHHCLGAPLARMEMRIAFPALFRRFPNLALTEEVHDIRFHAYNLIYGAQSLPVTW